MRFVTYAATADGDQAGADRIGVDRVGVDRVGVDRIGVDGVGVDGVGVINGDLIYALPDGTSLIELLGSTLRQAGRCALAEPAEVVAPADVTLKAPLPRPPSIRDCLCFLDHMRACRKAVGCGGESWSTSTGAIARSTLTSPHSTGSLCSA
ncbi:hypothetical protein [Streptomyces tubercidicus]|uniref:hypothetical protein n=1 Tax=Streptomyces tubercidicus TaxID=47759 RepID=UPI0036C41CA9